MNRTDLQNLARMRLRDARLLLWSDRFESAYYLAGYAVECALKACIARETRRHDFPDKKLANDSFTHDLEKLVDVAGLSAKMASLQAANRQFELNWTIVKDWTEQSRYLPFVAPQIARDFYSAITARQNGIMTWLRQQW
jgi:HEPN domain-containing protein